MCVCVCVFLTTGRADIVVGGLYSVLSGTNAAVVQPVEAAVAAHHGDVTGEAVADAPQLVRRVLVAEHDLATGVLLRVDACLHGTGRVVHRIAARVAAGHNGTLVAAAPSAAGAADIAKRGVLVVAGLLLGRLVQERAAEREAADAHGANVYLHHGVGQPQGAGGVHAHHLAVLRGQEAAGPLDDSLVDRLQRHRDAACVQLLWLRHGLLDLAQGAAATVGATLALGVALLAVPAAPAGLGDGTDEHVAADAQALGVCQNAAAGAVYRHDVVVGIIVSVVLDLVVDKVPAAEVAPVTLRPRYIRLGVAQTHTLPSPHPAWQPHRALGTFLLHRLLQINNPIAGVRCSLCWHCSHRGVHARVPRAEQAAFALHVPPGVKDAALLGGAQHVVCLVTGTVGASQRGAFLVAV